VVVIGESLSFRRRFLKASAVAAATAAQLRRDALRATPPVCQAVPNAVVGAFEALSLHFPLPGGGTLCLPALSV